MKSYLILSTAPSRKIAEKLGGLIVRNRLAACVNVIPGVKSFFWWKGKVERAHETVLLIKTTRARWSRLLEFLRKNHPYEVPELIALPLEKGLPAYLKWLEEAVS